MLWPGWVYLGGTGWRKMGAKQVDPTTAMEEINICTMILTVAAHLECMWFCIDINILLCDDIVCWKIVCSVDSKVVWAQILWF